MKTAVQIAVEKLEQFIPSGNQLPIRLILDEALEIEKQQIMEAYRQGLQDYTKHDEGEIIRKEQYYNETYKNKG
jgi:hypothetical protein